VSHNQIGSVADMLGWLKGISHKPLETYIANDIRRKLSRLWLIAVVDSLVGGTARCGGGDIVTRNKPRETLRRYISIFSSSNCAISAVILLDHDCFYHT
jgi:hypothetical protein